MQRFQFLLILPTCIIIRMSLRRKVVLSRMTFRINLPFLKRRSQTVSIFFRLFILLIHFPIILIRAHSNHSHSIVFFFALRLSFFSMMVIPFILLIWTVIIGITFLMLIILVIGVYKWPIVLSSRNWSWRSWLYSISRLTFILLVSWLFVIYLWFAIISFCTILFILIPISLVFILIIS